MTTRRRRFLLILPILLLAAVISAGLAVADPAAARPPLRFAWLSDTHVGSDRGAADLRASVADINKHGGFAFVLVTGDVTEMGLYDNFRAVKDILDGLRVPYHIIPGNHDTKWSDSGGSDFRRIWGDDRFVFEEGGFRFIGLAEGPVLKMGDGHFAPQDVRWLDERLTESGPRETPTVFVSHYPLNESIDNWYVVLDKLKSVPTVAILVGHGHANRALDLEGLNGVMGRANIGTKNAAPGYTVVEIDARAMTFAERTGGKTRAPWHRIGLGKNGRPIPPKRRAGPAKVPAAPPRPDFGVNGLFPDVRVRWRFDAGWTIASSAAVSGDTVVFGDASGSVRALRIADGSIAWEFKTDEPVYSTPAVGGGRVVFAGTDGAVTAVDARVGTLVWKVQTGGPIVASPAIDDGVVYIGSSDHVFRAIRLDNGGPVWSQDGIEGFVEARPLVAGGMVVFGAWDGRLYALEARTGRTAWTWQGEKTSPFYAPAACWPVAADGKVFIVAPDNMMTGIELASGRELWGTDNLAVRESIGLSEDAKRVYVRAVENIIAAVDPAADGQETFWETDAGFGPDISSAQLVEKGGVLFYGTKNGLLLALDGATGAVKWKHRVGVALLNTATPVSGREVVVTDADGHVTCLFSGR
ncbi:MAG TPA: PQQ-binding-like beta-propeller repeat protein [Acidobacteriota bacterium]|nr:PQQ-binding-like beta-propeller repeat protein [Acidobacteriota bacterium]